LVARSVTITVDPSSSKPTWAGLVASALSGLVESGSGVRVPSPATV
jgi:hypothetical protein